MNFEDLYQWDSERFYKEYNRSKEKGILINADCVNVIKQLDDECVDLIVTDPPYKITSRGNGGNSGGMFQKKEVNNGGVLHEPIWVW